MEPNLEQRAAFSIFEAEAAVELGISRETMREKRTELMTEGQDWIQDGRDIKITPGALAALKDVLSDTLTPEEKKAADEAPTTQGEVKTFTVSRVTRNPKIILAKKEGGEEVRVRVKNNRNFLPGMEVRARQDLAYDDVFVLEGRCPRYRGRW